MMMMMMWRVFDAFTVTSQTYIMKSLWHPVTAATPTMDSVDMLKHCSYEILFVIIYILYNYAQYW